ncbi:HD domain-containing protein [Xanthomonas phaseoli pv. phaseoli]|nr:HD domain-containing protein [Xanthomonas phaseoli pv. phaseoli]
MASSTLRIRAKPSKLATGLIIPLHSLVPWISISLIGLTSVNNLKRTDELVERARSLAAIAHASQTDKAGLPYLGHVARVAERVTAAGHCCEAIAAAWLHDVLEDQPEHADAVLLFPAAVVEAVDLLTRKEHVSTDSYYAGIRCNRIALAVKAADIADNSSAERLGMV